MGSDFFSMCDLNIAARDVAALCSGDFSECSRNLVDATFHVLKRDVNSLLSLLVLCTPLHSEPNNTQFMQKAPSTFGEYASHGNKFNQFKTELSLVVVQWKRVRCRLSPNITKNVVLPFIS